MQVAGKDLELPAIHFSPPDDRDPSAVLVMLHQTDGDRCGWELVVEEARLAQLGQQVITYATG